MPDDILNSLVGGERPEARLAREQQIRAAAQSGPVMPGGGMYEFTPVPVCDPHVISVAAVQAEIAAHTFAADTVRLKLEADRLNAETALLNAQASALEARARLNAALTQTDGDT